MADYDLSGVWLNGEHLIVDDAHLQTREGAAAATWTVVMDGAHILHQGMNERVELKMATGDGREVEGQARVTDPGDHDEASKVYDGVRFEGVTTLREVH